MKILWITFFGSWTLPLINLLKEHCEIGVIIPTAKQPNKEIRGIKQYCLGLESCRTTTSMSLKEFTSYQKCIQDFEPDLIHVHGTEKNMAQIQKYCSDIPVIVSIQGILSGYIPYWNNYLSLKDISNYKTLKNFLGRGGYDAMRKVFYRGRQEYESEILKNSKYFFCRTDWDKAWITFNNPDAIIYKGEELLRDVFYSEAGKWNISSCQRHTIFMPSGFNPIKGLHLAIKAVTLLKHFYPDVKLYVPGIDNRFVESSNLKSRIFGEEYINYCRALIKKNHLEKNIIFLGRLDGENMAENMLKANVFISPSSIDNSPNAVGEATMIGIPIVTTPVGGVPSILTDNKSCLFAPAGDEYVMAYKIKQIFSNDILAMNLGENAYKVALKRHNRAITVKQYIEAYHDIITQERKSRP